MLPFAEDLLVKTGGALDAEPRCSDDSLMKRITISLPEELAATLGREARRRHAPLSEVVREALASRFEAAHESGGPLPFANLGSSGLTDTARRIEEILAREWVPPDSRKNPT